MERRPGRHRRRAHEDPVALPALRVRRGSSPDFSTSGALAELQKAPTRTLNWRWLVMQPATRQSDRRQGNADLRSAQPAERGRREGPPVPRWFLHGGESQRIGVIRALESQPTVRSAGPHVRSVKVDGNEPTAALGRGAETHRENCRRSASSHGGEPTAPAAQIAAWSAVPVRPDRHRAGVGNPPPSDTTPPQGRNTRSCGFLPVGGRHRYAKRSETASCWTPGCFRRKNPVPRPRRAVVRPA